MDAPSPGSDRPRERRRKDRMMLDAPMGTSGEVRRDPELERIAAYLKPLASPLRLRLLRYLTEPHYIEEVASELRLSRQGARKHLDKLRGIGVLEKRPGERDGQGVTDYVVNLQALFLIYDEFEKLGNLRPRTRADLAVPTKARPVRGQEALAAPRGAHLLVVRGFGFGRTLALAPITGKSWTLGRDRGCDLPFTHDPYASSRQAEVSWAQGRFVLTDLRSTNGTEHNLAPLPSGGSAALRHGDLVGIGRTLVLFRDGS